MSLSTSSQQVALVDLPHAALHAILQRAGLRSRELCAALLDVYGPLPRLTPRGVASFDELLLALMAGGRHRHLRVLDLSHVDQPLTEAELEALGEALPDLRTLHLPSSPPVAHGAPACTLASVAAAPLHLPRLEALHAPRAAVAAAAAAAAPERIQPAPRWSRLRELTLPAAFLTALGLAALQQCTRLSRLRIEGLGSSARTPPPPDDAGDATPIVSLAAQLPAFAALELRGRRYVVDAADLLPLTATLSSLALVGVHPRKGTTREQLLQHIGALGSLRSLELQPAAGSVGRWITWHGWLPGLTRLTRLQVAFGCSAAMACPCGCAEVLHDARRLPALRDLRLAKCFAGDGGELSAALWEGIAASCSALRTLHLGGLTLPPNLPQALSQLAGLTCLRVVSVYKHLPSFGVLTALTGLRELCYVEDSRSSGPADSVLPCELLTRLANLHTLTLGSCSFVDGSYLERLCGWMPQLTSLDLSRNSRMGAGLSALQRLTNLEVLGLEGWVPPRVLLEHVRVPVSLRRCYLGGSWRPEGQVPVREVLGRHVEAVFDCWVRWQ